MKEQIIAILNRYNVDKSSIYYDNIVDEIIALFKVAEMPTDSMKNIWHQYEIYCQGQHYHNEKKLGFLRWFRNRMRDCESKCLLNYSFKECKYTEPKHEACNYCDKFRNRMKGGEK